jgi:hypothetical protein
MSYSAALALVGNAPSVSGTPRRIERANVALNHGLLIGELLGVSIGDAQRVLDTLSDRAEPDLTASEMRVLHATYGAVRAALGSALEAGGQAASNRQGEGLRSSDLLEADASGVLMIRHRRMSLTDLRLELEAIDRMMIHALDHGATIRLEQT